MTENSEAGDSEAESLICTEDLIDEMVEIRDLFITGNFETLKKNIEGLKQTIALIIRANIGLERLSSSELELLKDIAHAPRCHVKQLLRENFSRLSSMFTKMNLTVDNIDEDKEKNNDLEDSPEEDSSEGSENEMTSGQKQNSDTDSDINAHEDKEILNKEIDDVEDYPEEDSSEGSENEMPSGQKQNSDTDSDINAHEDKEILNKESGDVEDYPEEDSSESSENEMVSGQNSDTYNDNKDTDHNEIDIV